MATTYQGVRDNLITLTVELDDKSKLSDTLQSRIQQERDRLEGIEVRVESEMAPVLEMEKKRQREEAEKLMASTNELVAKKKNLLAQCESLVSEVSRAESEIAAAVKKVYEEGQKKADAGRRHFKAGAEERQKKQIAAKYAELLESTRAAMEPEFSRLRLRHERDVNEAECAAMERERAELAEVERQHQSRIAAEEKRLREEYRSRSALQLDGAIASVERMEREHKQKIEKLRRDLEAEHRQYCVTQEQQQLSRFDEGAEVSVAEEALQERLATLRRQQSNEISALEKEHTTKLRGLRDYMNQRKKEVSLSEEQRCATDFTSAQRHELKKYELEVRAEHEAALKRSVGQMQAEAVQEHRQLKRQTEQQRKDVAELGSREVLSLQRRKEGIDEEIDALGVQREELAAELRRQTMELQQLQESLAVHRRKRAAKQNELEQMQFHTNSLKERYEEKKASLINQHTHRVEELGGVYEDVKRRRSDARQHVDETLADIEAAHEDRLEALNQQARSDIAGRDADIDLLRDALQTEKVKLQRLRKILGRYAS